MGKISGFAQWCVEIDGGAKGVAAAVSIIETESSSHGKEFALRRARTGGTEGMKGKRQPGVGNVLNDIEGIANAQGSGDNGMRPGWLVVDGAAKMMADTGVGGQPPEVMDIEDDAGLNGGSPPAEGRRSSRVDVGSACAGPPLPLRGHGLSGRRYK